MQLSKSFLAPIASLFLLSLTPRIEADPAADLARFSVFPSLDLNKLANGKVLVARGPALDFPRDLTVQALYLVTAPLARTVELHKQWDPTRHPEMKVYLHADMPAAPHANDFSRVGNAPNNGAVKALLAATQKLPDQGQLQMSNEEAHSFKGSGATAVNAFWSNLLLQRATSFATHGLSGEPPYQFDNQSARVADEVSRLLKEQPNLRGQFRPLLEKTPLGGAAGAAAPSNYWELFDVDGMAAFSLGASYAVSTNDSAQLLDLQYYASSGYFVFITLYQMWPVDIGGKPATLVWRGDMISSLSLSELHGIERMGSGAAMMKEIQRMVNYFQKDTGQ